MKHSNLPSLRQRLLACVLALAVVPQLFAAHPSDLDPTFGSYQPNFGGIDNYINAIQILPGGSYYFAGTVDYSVKGLVNKSTLELYNPGGAAATVADEACRSIPPSFRATYDSMVLQPDGKLVVAGTLLNNMGQVSPISYLLVRCNSDRTQDTSFNGTGMVSGSFGEPVYQSGATEVLLRPDGKLVVTGTFTSTSFVPHFAAAQYHSNGTLDTSFGTGGKILVALPNGTFARSAALQTDGKVVISGLVGSKFGLVRLLANGTLDLSFGQQGVQITDIAGNQFSYPFSIKLQPDGKMLVAGYTDSPTNLDFVITRHNQNGSLDATFGANGIVFSAFGSGYDLDVMPNGKIVACGSTFNSQSFVVARYHPNGKPDRSFGNGGVSASFSGVCNAIKVQENGQIIAAGGVAQHQLALRLKGGERAETVRFDFDGDGQADISGFRPSNGNWTLLRSGAGNLDIQWGLASDTLVPADYDGDGKTNVAIYRNGAWKIILADGSYQYASFGQAGDLPRPGDFDGDGKADIAFWRPSNGTWNWVNSSNGHYQIGYFGTNGDVPLIADIDGDGLTEQAVFRPSNGDWYFLRSSDGQYGAVHFGATGDLPVVGDFDGDGKTDLSVFRPSNGYWYRLNSSNGQFVAQQFGTNGDIPVTADYDGDNQADIAVYRPSNNIWYILNSGDGITYTQYGLAGDRPVPSVFLP